MAGMPIERDPLHRVTVEDLFAIQDDKRYELFGGEVHVVPPPAMTHQWASGELARRLANHVTEHELGLLVTAPVAVILGELDYVEPDIVFVAGEHMDRVNDRGVEGAPDLVVEILSESPGSRHRDVTTKYQLYERAGIPHYWIVDPRARTLAAHELRGGRYELAASHGRDETFKPSLFPGLQIPLGRIWPPPLAK